MHGWEDAGGDAVAEEVRADQAGQGLVEVGEVGEATAKDDHLRVEQVDDARQATRQTLSVSLQGGHGGRFAAGGGGPDLGWGAGQSGMVLVVRCHARSGEEGLEAPLFPAVTGGTGCLIRPGPG